MQEKKYLNEEKYQKAERSLTLVAILVLVVGLCIGGFLIYSGFAEPETSKVDEMKVQLEAKKQELESKGVKYSQFTKYSDGEAYDLKVITNALDPSFKYCEFDEYKDNSLTKEYCSATNSTSEVLKTSLWGLGAFICVATCMIAGAILVFAKKRHILAFSTQQVMPVVKEGIDEMAPTIGNAAGEVAKGIKKGLNDANKNNNKE